MGRFSRLVQPMPWRQTAHAEGSEILDPIVMQATALVIELSRFASHPFPFQHSRLAFCVQLLHCSNVGEVEIIHTTCFNFIHEGAKGIH